MWIASCDYFLAYLSRRLKWAYLITISSSLWLLSYTFHIFIFFSRITMLISNKLNTNFPWVMGIQVCSNEGPRLFPMGDNYEIAKIHCKILKILRLQNHWANFKQTWPKASLSEGDSSLFKWRTQPFCKEIKNSLKNFKNLLLQNHKANSNQTWHKSFLAEGDSSLFKWRAPLYSKGDAIITK